MVVVQAWCREALAALLTTHARFISLTFWKQMFASVLLISLRDVGGVRLTYLDLTPYPDPCKLRDLGGIGLEPALCYGVWRLSDLSLTLPARPPAFTLNRLLSLGAKALMSNVCTAICM
mmetsp:Transcript_22151/g.37844  ORF Transcript_22151/g.37844 Transcript_22151/m.37844 type:complete len:119 (-) Transcript_22151:1387-1743(-)